MTFLATVKDEARSLFEVASGITFKKSYTAPQVYGKQTVGFNEYAFSQVDNKYKVVIENSQWVVNAWLQENFRFKVGSQWGSLLSSIPFAKEISGVASSATKALTGHALKNIAMTRRKWEGTDPLSIELKMRFRAYENSQREVVDAVKALQSMTLPAEMGPLKFLKGTMFGDSPVPGFVMPPGPNEFYSSSMASVMDKVPWGGNDQRIGESGDIISIDMFGGGFYLDMVIIKSVEASFDPKMTKDGPVAAEVSVLLESYEVLTKGKLDNAYRGIGYTTSSNQAANASAGRVEGVRIEGPQRDGGGL